MSYTLACGDIVEGCTTTLEADSEDDLMASAGSHASEAHGITEVTPELAEQVKGAIKPA
ncbi:MAG: DUF1059 domain-containing protein [Acidimicrobiia bacterium]|nr:DUF1059 domain-containing protein [Acidimicrobiia bacterium]